MEATIYEELVKAGVPIDSHEGDLYALKTPESEAIVSTWDYTPVVTIFKSQIDGKIWFDIPFGYKPFWDSKIS